MVFAVIYGGGIQIIWLKGLPLGISAIFFNIDIMGCGLVFLGLLNTWLVN
jgi:hypothetical protein